MSGRQKRARTTVARARRPIDKSLISEMKTITASQQETVLITATFPCTIVGLRWELSFVDIIATTVTNLTWAIVLVKDGQAASTMAVSDAGDFYTPEQNVLAFGVGEFPDADLGGGNSTRDWRGSTKTMRKLMGGDRILIVMDGSAAAQGTFLGVVQFFCKS